MKSILPIAFLIPFSAQAQLIFSDTFDLSEGSSNTTGFGTDGVNSSLESRLSGQASVDVSLSYYASGAAKADTAYSIDDNALRIDPAPNIGSITLTADGFTAFDFGDDLRGKIYEINLTIDNDTVDTINRRCSFSLATAPAQTVDAVPFGIQLAANANQASAEIFKRIDASSNPNGGDVNQSIAADLPYGEPVELRLVFQDVDTTIGQLSTYEIYLNDGTTPIDSGNFGISLTSRYLVFDIAPNSGPIHFDNLSVTVTGDAPEPPVITDDRFLYFVGDDGEIYGFSGIQSGEVPVADVANFRGGFHEASQFGYREYQAFTCDPTSGIVYGINLYGDVVTWPTVADWLSNTAADIPTEGDPRYEAFDANSIHGASYDPHTGGFYVVYEGDATIDGDIGEYATVSDFITNSNATITTSTYGGNLLNFYYWGEDAPGNRLEPHNLAGANYFQASGGGQLEGFQTLAEYAANPENRTFQKPGFCTGCIAAFALPMPIIPDLHFRLTALQRDGAGSTTHATLEFDPQPSTTYSISASPDLMSPFTPVPGFEDVANSPIIIPVPSGFETRGFFRITENP
ncbi:hypothetical protein HNR46_003041 [Haloferula luteola]|uniref:Uncharacterized protein n=1 Tax=Haloferula luteola TaxID=595692 RepID=A0A840V5A0_9BACT|nr:hypothetical protein [Haloferula luteola]MBB5352793.1 hypothetical protein [Haloferula luteola]